MSNNFIDFCIEGNLNGMIEHMNTNKINIHANDEEGFRLACRNGHLHIVEYLINLHKIRQSRDPYYSKINIHANNEEGFKWDVYVDIIILLNI